MSRIRLLVSDIDGTLTRSDKTLSDAVVAAVRRAQAAGLMVSLISARPPSGMFWIAERLKLNGLIGAFNGGTLVECDGTPVSSEQLDPQCAKHALALLEQPCVTPWLFAGGNWYAKTLDNGHVDRERRSANVDPVICADFTPFLGCADKIVGVSDDHDKLAEIEAKVAEALSDIATVARSQPYYLDVTALRANKGDGLIALAKAYDVPLDAVAVLGDQNNDLPMFEIAGLSVAMGQAPNDVRAAADHVSRSNDEDGVADAIDRFVLPAAQP